MKECRKCGTQKPLEDFYKCKAAKDGREGTCKTCRIAADAKLKKANPERAYRASLAWRQRNRDKVAEYSRRFREERPDVAVRNNARRAKRHPEKAAANRAVRQAVQRGALVKPARRERCEAEKNARELDGHHEDYSKPLEVEWLCRQCHVDRHNESPSPV